MEEEPTNPYEQQLYDVFKSCLVKGYNRLNKDGLLDLCNKLELDKSHREAIFELLKVEATQKFVSFYEFRDAFLTLLDNSQETPINGLEKEVNGESESLSKNITMCTRYNHQPEERKQAETINCQPLQNDKVFKHQRLQETWTNQNKVSIDDVNSFLNRNFGLSKQAIQVIFEKLDMDCDGLISLNEFLNFFQSANKLQEQSNVSWSSQLQRDHTKSESCKDFVHHQNGTVLRSAIIESWEVAGISEANVLLLDLGFDGPTINLIDLSNALSSELKLHRDASHSGGANEYVRLLKGALILYQEEVRNLSSSMEHLRCERDKLRADINEANERAHLFAQEMDDQQTKLEREREEQLRQLELRHGEVLRAIDEQQQLERERTAAALKSVEGQLRNSQLEEQRLRVKLGDVLKSLRILEAENLAQAETVQRLETTNGQLSLQVRELASARQQVDSFESKEQEQVTELSGHIKELQTELKLLRDHNDELTSELEMLKHRDSDAKSVVSSADLRSTMSDENDGLTSVPSDTEDEEKQQQQQQPSKASKTTASTKVTATSTTTTPPMTTRSVTHDPGSPNKLSDIIEEFREFLTRAKLCADCLALRTEVSSLISELELYQSSVPSPKATHAATALGKRRKHMKNLANELEAESNGHSRDCCDFKSEKLKYCKRISSSAGTIHDLENSIDHLDVKLIEKKLLGLDDGSTCEKSEGNNNHIGETNNDLESEKKSDDNADERNEEELRHAAEKKQLLDRCVELEKSLDLLRSEYDQCEDYWAGKLDEERQLFEQELKINDEKLTELLVKMTEYEEQFSSDKRDGRLSPIEERAMLEQQYTMLEEEFDRFRIEAQEELARREAEIEELRAKLEASGEQRRRESLIDNAVQFPDESMRNAYPHLYSALCPTSSGSAESTNKSDASTSTACKLEDDPQCSQCHKPIQSSCDCQASNQQQLAQQQQQSQQQSQLPQREHKSRRSGDGKNRHHHHYYQKRPDMDYELMSLAKQKDKLKQEIMRLQSIRTMSANHIYPYAGPAEQNVVSNLYAKLYAQEQKHKYLQFLLTNQQKENKRIVQSMWHQHVMETTDLRHAIKVTEEKLKQQVKINKEQSEKLMTADVLSKELFVENAKLSETMKTLQQHCQILTQNRIESTT